ncbi:MAG: DUF1015 domain-containing protein [Candidatus Omnitrophica bacterium]|nr:DUF1015 domain-containing protein [Candidatus Omnitrophota bacterium]MDD5310528.1 DUF1015 domain-containing protein [Candidatus Omnitrophota bacterium]MDD5546046.1 DUF1015 domain-containing protein [Candidatus Omnitrophota bacterium]
MTIIKPFRGYRYDPKTVGILSKAITPPYDVINKEQQASYYKNHPYNFIRLDLGKTFPKDNNRNNRYARAGDFLEEWIDKGILVRDPRESVYIYDQEYADGGRKRHRLGFISLARLEEDRTKGFLPHERTFRGPKLDRLNLMKETGANLSPIFSIVIDENKKVMNILRDFIKKNRPAVDVRFEGTRNRIWLMSEAAAIRKLQRSVKSKRALIADGHHRYEVSLEYRDYMRSHGKAAGPAALDYVMMYFATSDPSGLTILPTHRMVEGLPAGSFRKNIDKIKKFFDIIHLDGKEKMFAMMKADRKHTIGVYLGGRDYLCLSLKRRDAGGLIKSANSDYWKNLDVVVLHRLVFDKALGIRGKEAERRISFTRDPRAALEWAAPGKGRAAFFLSPPALDEIKNIVKRQERMPHKTTYFYPKPPSGLVINKIT